jgi:hypothetical protein
VENIMVTNVTASVPTAKTANEKYTFLNQRLRYNNPYATGDIYNKKRVADSQEEWEIYR